MRSEPEPQPAAASLRASRADRERVIDLLKVAFVEGRLARDEFDARVGRALTSRTYADLAAVAANIPSEPVAEPAGTLTGVLPRRPPVRAGRRISMNAAITGGAFVAGAANLGMMAALASGNATAVILVAVFAVIGVALAIGAMIVAP